MNISPPDSITTSMFHSFKVVITDYHRQEHAQNDRKSQLETKKEADQPGILEIVDAVIDKGERCPSLKCGHLPM